MVEVSGNDSGTQEGELVHAKEWGYPERPRCAKKHKTYCSCNKGKKHQGLLPMGSCSSL